MPTANTLVSVRQRGNLPSCTFFFFLFQMFQRAVQVSVWKVCRRRWRSNPRNMNMNNITAASVNKELDVEIKMEKLDELVLFEMSDLSICLRNLLDWLMEKIKKIGCSVREPGIERLKNNRKRFYEQLQGSNCSNSTSSTWFQYSLTTGSVRKVEMLQFQRTNTQHLFDW